MNNSVKLFFFFAICFGYFTYFQHSPKHRRKRRAPILTNALYEKCLETSTLAIVLDDAPSISTNSSLSLLEKFNIPATFFVSLTHYKDLWFRPTIRLIHEKGFTIGIRFTPGADPRKLTQSELKERLIIHAQRVRDITGLYPKLVQFDYGKVDDQVSTLVRKLGFIITSYSLDIKDSNDQDLNDLLTDRSSSDGRLILEMMDSPVVSKVVPLVAAKSRSNQWNIIPLLECIGVVIPTQKEL